MLILITKISLLLSLSISADNKRNTLGNKLSRFRAYDLNEYSDDFLNNTSFT